MCSSAQEGSGPMQVSYAEPLKHFSELIVLFSGPCDSSISVNNCNVSFRPILSGIVSHSGTGLSFLPIKG